MNYTDETRLPFGNDQVKGEKLEDISNHWFRTFWKHNDDWYLSIKEEYGKNPFKTPNSYSHQRFEVMAYIEENFEPNEL